jgi:hypothetical protein
VFEDHQTRSNTAWHDRYAHLSFKGLSTLAKKQMVKGLQEHAKIEDNCVDCLIGKQSGVKLLVHYFRTFGCITHVKV